MVLKNLQSIAFLCLLDYRINCMAESMADDVKYGGRMICLLLVSKWQSGIKLAA